MNIVQLLKEGVTLMLPPLVGKVFHRIVPRSDFRGDFAEFDDAASECPSAYLEPATVKVMQGKAESWREAYRRSPVRDELVMHLMGALWVCQARQQHEKGAPFRVLD